LVRRAIARARLAGHKAILLVGDAPYYNRFGFSVEQTKGLWMPGSFERDRLLGLELKPAALGGASGMIGATGELAPKPDLNALIAANAGANGGIRHAVVQRAA
jgi:predicted N-acetyltransferase YhbS